MSQRNEMEYPWIRSEGYEQPYVSDRTAFIRRTYLHLAGAILAFIGLETLLLTAVPTDVQVNILKAMLGSPFSWLIVLAAFMGASYLAQTWARSESSPGTQYLGLGLYVVAEAIIFMPILWIAMFMQAQNPAKYGGMIQMAAILTLMVFGGLTMSAFITRKDFSFLGPVLSVGMWLALGLIICAIVFGFTLGLIFSFAMVALMSGFILYQTSNVIHHYPTNMHVAAALELFASVALLFWYILRILMILNSRE